MKMGRPAGSKNKQKGADASIGHNSNGLRDAVSGDELKSYIERIENLNKQQEEIATDSAEVFKELKANGYDVKTVKAIIARRKLTAEQREERDAIMDQYLRAMGDFASTLLGEAGTVMVRGQAWAE